MKQLSHQSTRNLIRYAEGEVTTSEAAEIESGIEVSSRDRARLAEVREIMGHLKDTDLEVENADIVAEVRDRIDALVDAPSKPTGRSLLKIAFPIAACALFAIPLALFLMQRTQTEDEGFRVKTAGPAGNEREQWIGLSTYRVNADASPTPLTATMNQSDELVFAYTNGGETPFKYLMVFSVDEKGEVYWYYPAYEQAGTDPASVTIRSEGQYLELPDKITHEYSPGFLAIYGLFSDKPIPVSSIEEKIGELVKKGSWSAEKPPRLTIANTGQKVTQTRIPR